MRFWLVISIGLALILALSLVWARGVEAQPLCPECKRVEQFNFQKRMYACRNPSCVLNVKKSRLRMYRPRSNCGAESLLTGALSGLTITNEGATGAVGGAATNSEMVVAGVFPKGCEFPITATTTGAEPHTSTRKASAISFVHGDDSHNLASELARETEELNRAAAELKTFLQSMDSVSIPGSDQYQAVTAWIKGFISVMQSFGASLHPGEFGSTPLTDFIRTYGQHLNIEGRVGNYGETGEPVVSSIVQHIGAGHSVAIQLELEFGYFTSLVVVLNPAGSSYGMHVEMTFSILGSVYIIPQHKLYDFLMKLWKKLNTGVLGRKTKILAMHIIRPGSHPTPRKTSRR